MNTYFNRTLPIFQQVEYIPTENKGYIANGERHPYSWSIVDKEELVDWMME